MQVEGHYHHHYHLYPFQRHHLVSCCYCCYCYCEMTPSHDHPACLFLLEPQTKTLVALDRATLAHVYSPYPTIPGTPARPGSPGGCALQLQPRVSRLFLSAVALGWQLVRGSWPRAYGSWFGRVLGEEYGGRIGWLAVVAVCCCLVMERRG